MVVLLTKRARDVFAPESSDGAARSVLNADAQEWGRGIENAIVGAAEGYVTTATWAALAAIEGEKAGQPGRVISTTSGTHTDPVTGETVPNSGEYAWSVSPAGWRRLGDVIDPSAVAGLQIDLAAEAATRGAADTALDRRTPITLTDVVGADTITADAAGVASYIVGMQFWLTMPSANTITGVTLNLNGIGARAVLNQSGGALKVGELGAGSVVLLRVSGATHFRVVSVTSGMRDDLGGVQADMSILKPRVRLIHAASSLMNALEHPAVLVRFFPHSEVSPANNLRVYMPIGNGKHARMLLKRNSISLNPADVGQFQESWEPDVAEGYKDCAVFRIDGSALAGTWGTTTSVVAGVYARVSTNVGAARLVLFNGDMFALLILVVAGSAPIDLYVDGVYLETIPAGSGAARPVAIRRSGFGPGSHSLRYVHAGTEGQPIYVSGIDLADGYGLFPGATGGSASAEAPDTFKFLGTGVQTLAMRPPGGGLRMGGGHGGVRRLMAPIMTIDDVEYNPESVAATVWRAGRKSTLLESVSFLQPIDLLNPTGDKFVFATVNRKMTFRFGGYDCDMDILISGGADGRAIYDFLYGMAPLAANITRNRMPLGRDVSDGWPFEVGSDLATYVDPESGASVEINTQAQISSPDAWPRSYVTQASDGDYKHYGYAAKGEPFAFKRRQRVKYSMDFRPAA